MPAIILSDNGATSGSAGLKTSGGNDGVLLLQTTTSGGTPTTAISISNTQVVTYTNQPTYTGGTANGVLYLNGSKAVTSGTALVFDGTNLGVGVTPSAWSGISAIQFNNGSLSWSTNRNYINSNAYWNGTNWVRTTTGAANQFITSWYDNSFTWNYAGSGSSGATVSWTSGMTLDASGYLLIGTTTSATGQVTVGGLGSIRLVNSNAAIHFGTLGSPTGAGGFSTNGSIARAADVNYHISGSAVGDLCIAPQGGQNLLFGYAATQGAGCSIAMKIDNNGSITFGGYGYIKNFNSGYLGVGNGNTALMFLDESSSTRRVIPRQNNNGGSDGNIDLGDGGSRFRTLYATTGTINTSDAREKTAVTPLTADELTAASQIAASVGTYQWLQAVEEKGAAARHHAGLTVQRAIEIMEANNLNPFDYGFICYDTWPQESNKAAGDRYSFRMDQLSLFIARGQQAIIEQMQTRLAALEAK